MIDMTLINRDTRMLYRYGNSLVKFYGKYFKLRTSVNFSMVEGLSCGEIPALGRHYSGEVIVNEDKFLTFISVDRRLALRLFRSVIAHEIAHQKQEELVGNSRLFNAMYGHIPRTLEHEANVMSNWLSGIGREEWRRSVALMNEKAMKKYGVTLLTSRSLTW